MDIMLNFKIKCMYNGSPVEILDLHGDQKKRKGKMDESTRILSSNKETKIV